MDRGVALSAVRALRLARFNCLAAANASAASKEFRGFPIPAAAGLTASLTLFMLWMAEERARPGTVEMAAAGAADFSFVHDVQPVPVPQLQGAELADHAVDSAVYRHRADPGFTVLNYDWMPAVIFLVYLLYGFLRPFLSRRMQREIEEEILEEETRDASQRDPDLHAAGRRQ